MEGTKEQEEPSSILSNAIFPPTPEDAAALLLPEAVTKAAKAVKSCASSIITEHVVEGCVNNPGEEGKADVLVGTEPPRESGEACGVVKGVNEGKDELVVKGGEGVGGEGRDEVVVLGGEEVGVGGGGCVVDGLENEAEVVDGQGEIEVKEGEMPTLTEGMV